MLALLIFSAIPAYGQVTAKIIADTEVGAGDLVVLDGSHSSNAVHYIWKLINSDKRFLVFEEGEKVVTAFGTEGKYRFLLIVVGQDNNGKIDVDDTEWVITVGDGVIPHKPVTPVKPDKPNVPDDPIKPNVPNDQFDNLGQGIVNWSNQYLKSDGKDIVNRIGENYVEVAEGLENGDIFLNEVFSTVAKMNKDSYTTDGIYDQQLHDQFTLVGSRISEVYTKHKDNFDRDVMIDFLKVIGKAFRSL